MRGHLLDTNVISELRKANPDPAVARWAAGVPEADQYLSVITIGEIHKGCLMLRDREPGRAQQLSLWLGETQARFANRILLVDEDVAMLAAQLQVPDPRPINDTYIAATTMVHGLVMVTRNVRDFAGVEVLNPWEA